MSTNDIPYRTRLKNLKKDINRIDIELEVLREKLDAAQNDPYNELAIRQQIASKVNLRQNKLKEINRLNDEVSSIFANMKASVN